MNYAQFKAHVTSMSWRDNDTEVASNLDNIILMANAELRSRTHDWEDREAVTTIAPTSNNFDLSSIGDYKSVISLTNNADDNFRPFGNVTLENLFYLRSNGSEQICPSYAVNNTTLYLVGPFSVENPGDLTLVYRRSFPDYAVADSSWMADEHLNIYTYAVLKHLGVFTREDERIEQYDRLLSQAFALGDEEDKHSESFGGQPLEMQPTRKVP